MKIGLMLHDKKIQSCLWTLLRESGTTCGKYGRSKFAVDIRFTETCSKIAWPHLSGQTNLESIPK